LPAPAIQPPVHVCDSAVVVTGVIAGTKVRIEHDPKFGFRRFLGEFLV
jgi:hypothetical protein